MKFNLFALLMYLGGFFYLIFSQVIKLMIVDHELERSQFSIMKSINSSWSCEICEQLDMDGSPEILTDVVMNGSHKMLTNNWNGWSI